MALQLKDLLKESIGEITSHLDAPSALCFCLCSSSFLPRLSALRLRLAPLAPFDEALDPLRFSIGFFEECIKKDYVSLLRWAIETRALPVAAWLGGPGAKRTRARLERTVFKFASLPALNLLFNFRILNRGSSAFESLVQSENRPAILAMASSDESKEWLQKCFQGHPSFKPEWKAELVISIAKSGIVEFMNIFLEIHRSEGLALLQKSWHHIFHFASALGQSGSIEMITLGEEAYSLKDRLSYQFEIVNGLVKAGNVDHIETRFRRIWPLQPQPTPAPAPSAAPVRPQGLLSPSEALNVLAKSAANAGHLHVLKFIVNTFDYSPKLSGDVANLFGAAAKSNQIEIVKYLQSELGLTPPTKPSLFESSLTAPLKLSSIEEQLAFLREFKPTHFPETLVADAIRSRSSIPIIDFLLTTCHLNLSPACFLAAAANNDLQMVRFLIAKNCPVDPEAIYILSNDSRAKKWLIANGYGSSTA